MGLRPGRTIRDVDKPAWTRYSRRKPRKSYIKAMPHQELHQFNMGQNKEDYEVVYHLISEQDIQVRDNALESARQVINRYLDKHIPQNYYFVVRPFPHQVIRENKMISGAGADRLQKGMRAAYGRPTEKVARIRKGQEVFTIKTYEKNSNHIELILKRAKHKLSGSYKIKKEVLN